MSAVGLPRSDVRHPPRLLLGALRPLGRAVARRWWQVEVRDASRVPPTGPVILGANHLGLVDGPLLDVFTPRPVHALTKVEVFRGPLGGFLRAAGQIPVDRYAPDPGAVKACLRVLRDGGAVGIFPEGIRGDGELHRFHHGAAYLALVTGAPVVPVTFIGTRRPGAGANAVPGRGDRIDIVFGTPWRTTPVPWPRTREHVLGASALLHEHLRSELDRALAETRRCLPGPLPAGQSQDDPDTGFVEQTREPSA